jgi:cytochrome d ubiquinol oxidase subunit II
VPPGGQAGDPVHSWLNPTSILGGVLAVCVVAYLAAVYLVRDAARVAATDDGGGDLVMYFRNRAIISAVVAGVVALVGIRLLQTDSPYLFDGLTHRALPLVIVSAVCGMGSIVMLMAESDAVARALAIGAVAAVVLAWGVAQWDYVLPTTLTVSEAAAPDGTIAAVLVVFAIAVVVILPAFGVLFVLDQRGLLPEEGADEEELEDQVTA